MSCALHNWLKTTNASEHYKLILEFLKNSSYPANCIGMGELWRRVVAQYPQHYFSFNSEVTKIDPESKQVILN